MQNIETSNILSKKSIDAIFTFDVLQHIKDWDTLFLYYYDVLKPKGIVHILKYSPLLGQFRYQR